MMGTFALAAALVGGALTAAPAAQAASPYERGPAPTNASIEAVRGPFAVTTATISGQSGFGGGKIYYPTDTSQGTFGAVAIAPGFVSIWEQMEWLGPRLASQGFVVIGIQTNGLFDLPDARRDQLLAALNWAKSSSPAASRIDPNRLAVAGWSMGGGGTLQATVKQPSLKAAIAIAPWNLNADPFNQVRVPSLILGGSTDVIASPGSHAVPFYNRIPATTEKAYLEFAGKDHFFTTSANTPQAKAMIAWLKRWVDEDTRYSQFICPGPPVSSTISANRSTCPV